MRILFTANAGWATTGYGVQVRGLLPHLRAQGHDLAVFAFYGLEGGKVELPIDGIGGSGPQLLTHYPRLVDPNGWGPLKWLAWLPIDQAPIPEPVLARIPAMTRVLPYSRFGERLLQQAHIPS